MLRSCAAESWAVDVSRTAARYNRPPMDTSSIDNEKSDRLDAALRGRAGPSTSRRPELAWNSGTVEHATAAVLRVAVRWDTASVTPDVLPTMTRFRSVTSRTSRSPLDIVRSGQ